MSSIQFSIKYSLFAFILFGASFNVLNAMSGTQRVEFLPRRKVSAENEMRQRAFRKKKKKEESTKRKTLRKNAQKKKREHFHRNRLQQQRLDLAALGLQNS